MTDFEDPEFQAYLNQLIETKITEREAQKDPVEEFIKLSQNQKVKEWFNCMLLTSESKIVQRIYKMEKISGIYAFDEEEEPDTLPERIDMLAERIDKIESKPPARETIEEPKPENPLITNTTLTAKATALTEYLKNKKSNWGGEIVMENQDIYKFFREIIEENLRWPEKLKGYRGAKKSIIERAQELFPHEVEVVRNKSGNKITGLALKPSVKRTDTYGC
jgi:hypothetical protein